MSAPRKICAPAPSAFPVFFPFEEEDEPVPKEQEIHGRDFRLSREVLGTFKQFRSPRDTESARPSGHVRASAAHAREAGLCGSRVGHGLLPTPEPGGRGAAEGSRGGAACACAANSCHPVRNKSSKDPESLGGGRTFLSSAGWCPGLRPRRR